MSWGNYHTIKAYIWYYQKSDPTIPAEFKMKECVIFGPFFFESEEAARSYLNEYAKQYRDESSVVNGRVVRPLPWIESCVHMKNYMKLVKVQKDPATGEQTESEIAIVKIFE